MSLVSAGRPFVGEVKVTQPLSVPVTEVTSDVITGTVQQLRGGECRGGGGGCAGDTYRGMI